MQPDRAQSSAQVPAGGTQPYDVQRTITLGRLGLLLLLLAAWEIYGRFYADAVLIAPPSRVVAALGPSIFGNPQVASALFSTLVALCAAFLLSVIVGILVGIAVGISDFGRRSLLPPILLLYAIPQSILLPLFILGLGIGPASKIAFGFSHGVFPILVSTISAMRGVNPLLLKAATAAGASTIQVLRYIYLPHMRTSLFSALRLAMTMTMLGVLLAELFVSVGGIGYFARVFTETFDPAPLFALISVLAIIAIALNEGLRLLQLRFSRWMAD
jgi:ABC-type nitrate/sulfonate/bicarbonate transport system permease component